MRIAVSPRRALLAAVLLPALAACAGPPPADPPPPTTPEGDVLAPESYSLRAEGLWDGTPSLGGVWVAHAEVEEPARVRISLPDGGAAVTGSLFRMPPGEDGPELLVSSEAARALGLSPGEPALLEVVGLRPPAPSPPSPPDDEDEP
jgi:hypothetical protein